MTDLDPAARDCMDAALCLCTAAEFAGNHGNPHLAAACSANARRMIERAVALSPGGPIVSLPNSLTVTPDPAAGLDLVDPAVYAPTADAPAVGAVTVTEDDGDADVPLIVDAHEGAAQEEAGQLIPHDELFGECVDCHERRPVNRSGRCGPCDKLIPY